VSVEDLTAGLPDTVDSLPIPSGPVARGRFGLIEGQTKVEITEGIWHIDDDDWLLIAMLQDAIYMSELLFEDPKNKAYGGCYHVMDYQYPLFRHTEPYEGYPCARSVGKTESLKAKGVCHAFRRQGEDMLITAPELIHLLPLTDAIENRIRDTRLTREFLDTRQGKTGFTHKPFQCDFLDGTKIVGRIPKITGTGVKGQHVPDLLVDEGQDYPEKGWIEVHETVIKDHIDAWGKPDFTYHFYGVHTGARDGRFYKLSASGEFKISNITAIMRPGWGPEEKRRASAMYGGTQAPDYRRNILGEAGGASSAFFVTARLMACMDQDRESDYNTIHWKRQRLMSEELDSMLGDTTGMSTGERDAAMYELLGTVLDMPDLSNVQQIYLGMDIGLVNDPTVITMEADEVAPQHLLDVTRGYVFNSKLPIGVDKNLVSKDSQGNMRDAFGNMVEWEEGIVPGTGRFVVKMSMIEASTRYLREFVDQTYMQLPFDTEIAGDMLGETEQRVKAMAGVRKKPNAFHILDSMRTMAMVYKAADVDAQMAVPAQTPVLARAVDASAAPMALRQ
jgi:hypothetical protein